MQQHLLRRQRGGGAEVQHCQALQRELLACTQQRRYSNSRCGVPSAASGAGCCVHHADSYW